MRSKSFIYDIELSLTCLRLIPVSVLSVLYLLLSGDYLHHHKGLYHTFLCPSFPFPLVSFFYGVSIFVFLSIFLFIWSFTLKL